jgi:hypothetical protein
MTQTCKTCAEEICPFTSRERHEAAVARNATLLASFRHPQIIQCWAYTAKGTLSVGGDREWSEERIE